LRLPFLCIDTTLTIDMEAIIDALFWFVGMSGAILIQVFIALDQRGAASGIVVLTQCFLAFAPFSVMTVRASQETNFRPGGAKNLEQEFAAYGYPSWFFKFVRITKSSFALFIVVGLVWKPALVVGAAGIFVLMLGAVASHIKVLDGPLKSVPSFTLGCMSASILYAYKVGFACHYTRGEIILPAVFATENVRGAICLTMVVFFMGLVFQMSSASSSASAREGEVHLLQA